MKPSELYARTPERIDSDLAHLSGFYYNHLPEIEELACGAWIGDDPNKRIEIHYYKDFCFDGRRTWTLAGVKFDAEFVMITQNAGREGDDHAKRFITNFDKFKEMVTYIRTLLPDNAPNTAQEDIYGTDVDIEKLDEFYGNRLDGHFERY